MTEHATLPVPGATLYHERRGAGPPVLLIPGGNGDALPYAAVGEALADRYTVVAYERRGFARSPLDRPLGPGDDERRLAVDVDDAHRLLAHLDGGPAYVFGSSSGALVALELMARHPGDVRLLMPHEPPALTLLPDAEELARGSDRVYAIYRESGPEAAMAEFTAITFGESGGPGAMRGGGPPPPGLAEMGARMRHNIPFWIEHELRQYPRAPIDVAALRPHADRIAPLCGRESRGQYPYRPNTVLAGLLGRTVTELAGGHVGYLTHPEEFAAGLAAVLATAADAGAR